MLRKGQFVYRKLHPLVNRFLMVRQGNLGQMYVGRLLSVDEDALQLQTYQADGNPAACWTIQLSTVTEFVSESRQLNTLALKVKWMASNDILDSDLLANQDMAADSSSTQHSA